MFQVTIGHHLIAVFDIFSFNDAVQNRVLADDARVAEAFVKAMLYSVLLTLFLF